MKDKKVYTILDTKMKMTESLVECESKSLMGVSLIKIWKHIKEAER